MKRFGIILLIMITLVVQAPIAAYGESNTTSIAEERYQLFKEQNLRLRKEILQLRNQLSEKKASKIPVLMYHHLLKQEDIDKYNWWKPLKNRWITFMRMDFILQL